MQVRARWTLGAGALAFAALCLAGPLVGRVAADDGSGAPSPLPPPRVRRIGPGGAPAPAPPPSAVPPPAAPVGGRTSPPPAAPSPTQPAAPSRGASPPAPAPLPAAPAEAEPPGQGLGTRPEQQPRIVDIRFEGTALFAGESLQVLMQLKRGQRLDPVKLDQDIATLYRFFEDVRVSQEDVAGGVILHFLVEENPLVVELNIYGAEVLGSEEIRSMMSTRVGYPLFPYALASDAEDLIELYRMRGYYFAQVPEPVITTLAGGGRRVDFTVVEGPEVVVQRILFRGNAHIARRDLLEVMQTEEQGFIPFFSTAVFRMDVLLEDLVAVKRKLEDLGYLDAEVVLDDLRFSDDKQRVLITISIVEHQPYCVGNLEVEIDRLEPGEPGSPTPEDIAALTEQRLLALLGMQPGTRYSGDLEAAGLKRVEDEYFRRSYIDAQVQPLVRRGRERQNVVDLTLKVVEGAKSRVRRLDFVGNEFTRDKILRREARLCPGGYIDRREMDRTLMRLRRLGYFDRVTMQVQEVKCPDGTVQAGWKDVTYEVVEGSTGSLNFGIGLSTDGGVLGSISFSKRNFDITRWPRSWSDFTSRRSFTGAGQKLDIYLAPSTIESQFQVAFEEPRLFGSHLSFGVQVYKRISFWEDYTADRTGYGLSLGYPILNDPEDRYNLRARVQWRHEGIDVRDLDSNAVPGAWLFRGNNELRSLSLELAFRTVDDLVKPRWETSSVWRLEYAGDALGGDVDFVKTTLSHEQFFVLHTNDEGMRQSLTVRGEVGYAEAIADTPEVPPFERFYMGGSKLRGFSYRGAGPHISGNPTGGEWVILTTAEYLYPLVKDTLGLVAFVDAGTLATNIHAPDQGLWRVSVGAGIRLKVPVLGPTPLAFDFGFPLLYEEVDDRSLISFSVGRDF